MMIAARNAMMISAGYQTTSVTIVSATTNCKAFADAMTSLIRAAVGANASGVCIARSKRQNMILAIAFLNGTCALTGVGAIMRWRNNAASLANIEQGYDADSRAGDVYDVYYVDNPDWSVLPTA